jgi:hypothetical protein
LLLAPLLTQTYYLLQTFTGVWVATHVQTYAYAMASSTGFKRLFSYIEGENEDNVKIPMTAPVVTKIQASAGPFCKSNFTVAFFVPFDFQEDPPEPINPDVFIFKAPPFTAHVAHSGGFIFDDWTVSKMAKRLAEDLDSQGEKYDEDAFMLAGYDPPFRLQNRHTEVWFIDTSSTSQPNSDGDVLNVM